jgi:molybdopterin synthase catalytic subunit
MRVILSCCFHPLPGDDVIKFTDQPINPDIFRCELFDPTAGAYVGFEGWIRNENEGYSVERLEYEAMNRWPLARARK